MPISARTQPVSTNGTEAEQDTHLAAVPAADDGESHRSCGVCGDVDAHIIGMQGGFRKLERPPPDAFSSSCQRHRGPDNSVGREHATGEAPNLQVSRPAQAEGVEIEDRELFDRRWPVSRHGAHAQS